MNLICYAVCTMVIRVVEFSSGSTKLERFLLLKESTCSKEIIEF